MNVLRPLALAVVLSTSACLNFDPTGKVFACQGKSCPPTPVLDPQCLCGGVPPTCDATTLVPDSPPACLADGGCLYQRTDTACPHGCTNGTSDGDRCLGISCDA